MRCSWWGDFAEYYSFQPGNHPRLFFTAQDIPELRYRATRHRLTTWCSD